MVTIRSPWKLFTAVLTALLLAGCGASADSSDPGSGGGGTPRTSPSSIPPPATPPADPREVVASVEIRQDDLPDDFGANLMQSGDEVDGQVSLDLCSADFSSERLRTARHQVWYEVGDAPARGKVPDFARAVSSETIAYSPRGAEQAMRELRYAATSCPSGFVDSGVDGIPRYRTTIREIRAEQDWQADHLALLSKVRFQTGESLSLVSVYQRSNDLLAIVYAHTTSRNARVVPLARAMASVLSERLVSASSTNS